MKNGFFDKVIPIIMSLVALTVCVFAFYLLYQKIEEFSMKLSELNSVIKETSTNIDALAFSIASLPTIEVTTKEVDDAKV